MSTVKAQSTSRKRLLDALNHRQPDRIPVDFGGSSIPEAESQGTTQIFEQPPTKPHGETKKLSGPE